MTDEPVTDDPLFAEAPDPAGAAPATPPLDPVVAAFLRCVARSGWTNLKLADVATEANLTLAELRARFPDRGALVTAVPAAVDAVVLEMQPEPPAVSTAPRDRLFDLMMQRFECLSPHREGLRALMRGAITDPSVLLGGARAATRGMDWMMAAAGLDRGGWPGFMQRKALLAVDAAVMRVWLDDASPDLSGTMRSLDKALDRLAMVCPALRTPAAQGAAAPVTEAPAASG